MTNINAVTHIEDGAVITTSGALAPLTFDITRQGRTWAYGTLRDETAGIELLVFPALFETAGELLAVGARVTVTGRVDHRDDKPRLMAHELILAETAVA